MRINDGPRITVPADLALEDRVAGRLTFRALGYLAAAAGGVALFVTDTVTAPRVALGLPLAVLGVAGAFLRPGGRPLDAWPLPLLGYARRRRVPSNSRSADAGATNEQRGASTSATSGRRGGSPPPAATRPAGTTTQTKRRPLGVPRDLVLFVVAGTFGAVISSAAAIVRTDYAIRPTCRLTTRAAASFEYRVPNPFGVALQRRDSDASS
jgi:hypothetical protein